MERRKSGSSPSSTAKNKWGQSQEAPRENSQLEEGPERSGMRGKSGKQGGNSCLQEAPRAFASLAQLQIPRDASPWRKTIRKAQLGA